MRVALSGYPLNGDCAEPYKEIYQIDARDPKNPRIVGALPQPKPPAGAEFTSFCQRGGCFVHERHAHDLKLPRFAGWWGHNKETRFEMKPGFDPISGAEGWHLSNAPILQMAALRASLELFDEAGMTELRKKGDRLTGYLEYLLDQLPNKNFRIITPRDPAQRASQLSLQVPAGSGQKLLAGLARIGVICDYREPDIIRVAPVPLYNSFLDVWRFVNALTETQAIE